MKHEFRHNGTTKLVVVPQTDLEEALFKEIFTNPENVEIITIPNSKEIIIQKKIKKDD